MKPNIDLQDERVHAAMLIYSARARLAYEAALKVEAAVRSIYVLPKHEKMPRQTGSCVVLKIGDEVFILSAAHVFEDIGSFPVLVGAGERLHELTGDRFSTRQGPSGTHQDDPIDAVAFHITSTVPDILRSGALSLDDVDKSTVFEEGEFYVVGGFHASRSKRLQQRLMSFQEMYPTIEQESANYKSIGLDRARQIGLVFEDEVLVNGKWQKSPSMVGMSGGAVFRIPDLRPHPLYVTPRSIRSVLSGIIIERRKKLGAIVPTLVSSRIGYHLGLIDKYLPELDLVSRLTS